MTGLTDAYDHIPPLTSEIIAWMEQEGPASRVEAWSPSLGWYTAGILVPDWRQMLDERGDERQYGCRIPPAPHIRPEVQAIINISDWTLAERRAIADALSRQRNQAAIRTEENQMTGPVTLHPLADDVLWLTHLAEGASWPDDMAQRVQDAVNRVRASLPDILPPTTSAIIDCLHAGGDVEFWSENFQEWMPTYSTFEDWREWQHRAGSVDLPQHGYRIARTKEDQP